MKKKNKKRQVINLISYFIITIIISDNQVFTKLPTT